MPTFHSVTVLVYVSEEALRRSKAIIEGETVDSTKGKAISTDFEGFTNAATGRPRGCSLDSPLPLCL